MANPVITRTTVLYPEGRNFKYPGEVVEVIIEAMDADAVSVEVQLKVVDSQGNSSSPTTTVILQSDPLEASIVSLTPGHTATVNATSKLSVFVV